MILKRSELNFPDWMKRRYFPIALRSYPEGGWPEETLRVTKDRVPFKGFLRAVGAYPSAQLTVKEEGLLSVDPSVKMSALEEIALNCPLSVEEAEALKSEYEAVQAQAGGKSLPPFVHGLTPPFFDLFMDGNMSHFAALTLSLSVAPPIQGELVSACRMDDPIALLSLLSDPFLAGDALNRLRRDHLKSHGYESMSRFLASLKLFSYGRARLLMRIADAVPKNKRRGLSSDQAEFLLRLKPEAREALLSGEKAPIGGKEMDLDGIKRLRRGEIRALFHSAREGRRGAYA